VNYRFIGQRTPRKDAAEIVTGSAKFFGDIKQPNILYGKVLRSPHPHAIIKDIDTSRAERLPEVKAVLTFKNVPPWKSGLPAHLPILDSKVRFIGDAVALLAAETEDIAEEALDLINVKYEILPAIYDVGQATKPDAPQLWEQFPGNVLPEGCPWFGNPALQKIEIGDVEKGFREADAVAEGTYVYEGIPNPLPPEPPGIIAAWNGPDNLSVWFSTQSPYLDQILMYHSIGRNVQVKGFGTFCGGSYGSKTMSQPIFLQIAALARAAGRPVKMYYSKREHLGTYTVRLGSRIHGKIGLKKDGTVTAVAGDWLLNTGYYSQMTQGQVAVGCGEAQLAIRSANWDLKPKVICTNRTASGSVRGFGGQELKSAILPILTLAMEKLDLDPLEFFKKNYIKPGDSFCWRDSHWYICRSVNYVKAMEKGAEEFGWQEKWRGWLKPTSVDGTKRRGVGVGLHGNADTGEDISEAYVRLNPDATAMIYTSLNEHGTGQRSNLCKMVAEVLQLPLERISLTPPDSSIGAYEFGPAGSRGTYAIGSAFISAAEDARRQLFEMSAQVLDEKPEDLETSDGIVYVSNNRQKKIPWRRGMGFSRTIMGYGRFEHDFTMPNFMMTFVEVEVDVENGKVNLVNVVNATDVGQIIDPDGLKNQLNGCLGTAGIDSGLFEESILDKRGYLLNSNMIDYKWRTFAELPAIKNVILETPFPSHRFGAIGVGEVATAPGPSAVLMAVSNAIGARIYSYPLTPDKVLEALDKLARRKEMK
jgi:CO/xanthine dehydrogenase Mo-binding subunit